MSETTKEVIDTFYRMMDRSGWAVVMLAGFFEILWVICLKLSEGYTKLWPTLGTIPLGLLSAAFLAMSMRSLPMGTAYAVWLGIGAMGAMALGVYYFGESLTMPRMICIGLIMAGVVGLKLLDMHNKIIPPA